MGWGSENEEYARAIKKAESNNNDNVNHNDHAQLLMMPETAPSIPLRKFNEKTYSKQSDGENEPSCRVSGKQAFV